ncbi:MAG TPA: FGGY family carbohydrate kinase [Gammaproteobacteria bacterium]|nr:FGGY family carbohydrate kinase [Gammaproteobacteria bacterium]
MSAEGMGKTPHYLVLDQGSHASKALVFAAGGELLAAREAPLAVRRPRADWVEHDANEVVDSLRRAIAAVLAAPDLAAAGIDAAGLAIQRSSVVCWDRRTGEALSPVLSWQDRRNAAWLAAQAFDPDRLRRITGLVASPHYGASKLRWCLDELPAVRRALAEGRLCCGPLASFVLHRLLEERPFLVDPANASRTLLWDVRTHDWSAKMLAACGLPESSLPRCVPSRHAFGTLQAGGQRIPLQAMTGDQSAALFAWGAPRGDTLFVNIGTGAFVQRLVAGAPPDVPGLLHSVAWQDEDHSVGVLEGTVNGAGAALEWLASERGVPIDTLLESAPRWLDESDDPPLFINGVGGLGAPYWVADCPIRFSRAGSLAEHAVAVLESIVFLLQRNIEAMRESPGGQADVARRIIVSGGIARFAGVCERLSDLSGLIVERPADVEATARGLAWLLSGNVARGEIVPTCFAPQVNAALQSRYTRWREALESGVAGLVATRRGA